MSHQLPIQHFHAIAARISACTQTVYRTLGAGRRVNTYEKALARIFQEQQIKFAEQYPFGVPFYGPRDRGFYADFVVEGWVLVELKAVGRLTTAHVAQATDYLRQSGARLCLLINFGRSSLEIRTILPDPEWFAEDL